MLDTEGNIKKTISYRKYNNYKKSTSKFLMQYDGNDCLKRKEGAMSTDKITYKKITVDKKTAEKIKEQQWWIINGRTFDFGGCYAKLANY